MQNNTRDQNIEIYLDRQKVLNRNNVGFLALVGLGLAGSVTLLRRSSNRLVKSLAVGVNTVLLWLSSFGVASLYRLFYPSPVVIVNKEGISYDPPKFGPFQFGGSLRWDEIAAIYLCHMIFARPTKMKDATVLCILPRDVEAYMQHYNLLTKTAVTITMLQTSCPLMISEALLPISSEELLTRIRTQYHRFIEEHRIELREEKRIVLPART